MTFTSEIHTFHSGKPQPQSSSSSSTFASLDPATGRPLATVYTTTPSQLDDAVASAHAAFPVWSQTPAPQRAAVLLRAAALLRQRNHDLALTETLDTGKAWSETSAVDVVTGADVLEYYAHFVAGGLPGQHTQLRPDAFVLTAHEPLGVCAGIGAWNYPIQIALWKSAPCLAAGNCMVYKPSEVTPLHANTLASIYIEAGLPPGVFNVVYGDGPSVGAPLVAHPSIAKVSFTGQVSTGSKVAAEAARGMKGVTMELGGKSSLVVLPDADADEAADVAMAANFFSTGQVCTNGTRVFIPDTLLARVEEALVRRCREGIRMGLPRDDKTNFGPVVSAAQRDKVAMYIKHGRDVDGARVLYDGAADAQRDKPTPGGFWVAPVVFTDCTDDMRVAREEIFGPVMCLLPYPTRGRKQDEWMADVVRRANDTPMGLAAGVVSSDVGLAHDVVRQLHAGITWINTWGESPAEMPVGGWKMSGVGLENGHEGIRAYMRTKSTLVQLGKGACKGLFAKL
ncbi:aldehyde dehydrogenase family protein [Hirsutella rhossiliensis]|uniref:aldehyde dehydrogenase (NAD(+)) n=1 Tax=Hirsutella rhossiliensis TaxID=111463 RepID=A0A9P8MNJ5_9HYPO|nr:aldehyde dehydrogenase family domain-containing protein [Hirsutella rhossiliensis]KAH0958532.1 aldehyde dehydrogenase family domain-containing protein [Hirsutella rhossiliensis]